MKPIHFNKPQLEIMSVQAHKTLAIFGRGTGKSQGVIAPWLLRNLSQMPRSFGAFGTTTYTDMLLKILPAIERGWLRLGFLREKHFTVKQFHPKWKKPYRSPELPTYFVHTIYGSGIQLISADRPELSAGNDFDYLCLDEVKHLNYDNVKEILPTLRGNREFFGNNPHHHSWLFCTDRWTDSKADWLFQYDDLWNKTENKVNIYKILLLNKHYVENYLAYKKSKNPDLLPKMQAIKQELDKYRKSTFHLATASTLDNIDAIGIDSIRSLKQSLDPLSYKVHVLNEPLKVVPNGFYGAFNPSVHCYRKDNHAYVDNVRYEEGLTDDSRWYADINPNEALHIGCDYNAPINTVVVGQYSGKHEFRIVDHQFVKHPQGIDALVKKFDYWYRAHKHKVIYYYYDHTAVGGNAQTPDQSPADLWIGLLKQYGWHVVSVYLGQASKHPERYFFTNQILLGKRDPLFRVNSRLENLITALQRTGVKLVQDKFQKDKSSERSELVKPEQATHATEALDMLLAGIYQQNAFYF